LDGDPTGGPFVALGVNQMLIGVATRKYARSVRLPDGDLAGQPGALRKNPRSRDGL
jgi:hypothetical protein